MPFSLFPRLRELGLPGPIGVLQLGASYGQELREFAENGIRAGVFVEPLPEPFAHLSQTCALLPPERFIPVNALCAETSGKTFRFHVASNGGMSSSILAPGSHLAVNPSVHFTHELELVSSTVDELLQREEAQGRGRIVAALDLLYMDCQGAEFQILRGASRYLPQFKYIYTEVMRNELYQGQVPFLGYCHYLDALGFTLNDVYFGYPEQAGNALFIRKDLVAVRG
ncbi:FkbM family methyltransferase [Roseateles sp. DAIF2]|uniref:FkbM family methyltransferase n=1 Tax=Roseateles sp. DAIF2 TaxID=2714952 RepID=UPI0018A297BA|nr:FkbM family methyltransferase [Roseateles sp. DAIF2]QPF73763.1 FkbM family methyltransferase [Roseateles sp. DAIF2]